MDLSQQSSQEKLKSALSYAKRPELIMVDGWRDPIPFDEFLNLPDFPVDVLPDSISFLRDMILMVSEINQVDTGMTGTLALGALSTASAKKAVVDLESHQEPLCLYLASIADSGTRKTSTVKPFTNPLYEYEKTQQEVMKGVVAEAQSQARINMAKLEKLQRVAANATDAGQREELTRQAGELARKIAETPVLSLPVYIVDDITPEQTGLLMAENGERLAVISTEGGIFSIMAGRYSNGKHGNFDIYLKAHAGDPWSADRVSRGRVAMDSPGLTMCLAVQPDVIREIGGNREFKGRGLTARFLYSYCQNRSGYRTRQTKPYDENILKAYGRQIKLLMDIPLGARTIRLDREAQLVWDEFYNDIEKEMRSEGSLEYIRDWGSKLPGAVARIAGLLHIAENAHDSFAKYISAGIVGASCVIGAYYKEHALAAFGLMRQDKQIEAARKILEFITTRRIEFFQGRDVLSNKNCFNTMDDIIPGIKLLEDRGYIKVQQQLNDGPGRPRSALYIVNPIFLKTL